MFEDPILEGISQLKTTLKDIDMRLQRIEESLNLTGTPIVEINEDTLSGRVRRALIWYHNYTGKREITTGNLRRVMFENFKERTDPAKIAGTLQGLRGIRELKKLGYAQWYITDKLLSKGKTPKSDNKEELI